MNFIIYGKPNCVYCQRAKTHITKNGYPYTYKELGIDFTREELLEKFPNAKTFPQITVERDGSTEYVGGYDELIAMGTQQ
jgi:glutaredoxin